MYFSPQCLGDQMKEHEMDRACDALGGRGGKTTELFSGEI